MKKNLVKLMPEERARLDALVSKGTASARRIRRALILLAAADGDPDDLIAKRVRAHPNTIGRIRRRCAEEGLEKALSERPRPGKARLLDGRQEAHLLALACSPTPAGHAKWTLRLLADRLVELKVIEDISHQTVGRALKRGRSSPGSASNGVLPQ